MSKYHNKKSVIDGITFDSRLEADLYNQLVILKKAGKIYSFKCHVPFALHGHGEAKVCTYKLDFEVIMPKVGALSQKIRYVEAKGVWTPVARLKRKLFEAEYGTLEIHTKEENWKL